jgi:hypothetical protein
VRERKFLHSTILASSGPCGNTTVLLPDNLARSAYATKYGELFWSTYLPNGQKIPDEDNMALPDALSHTVQDFGTHSIIKKALCAMSLATIGRRDKIQWMNDDGLRLYSNALQEMAGALRTPQKNQGVGLLTATRLFSLYEVSRLNTSLCQDSHEKFID